MKIEIRQEWTDAEIDEVIKLYNTDANLYELSEELERPVIDILMLLEQLINTERIDCERLLILKPKESKEIEAPLVNPIAKISKETDLIIFKTNSFFMQKEMKLMSDELTRNIGIKCIVIPYFLKIEAAIDDYECENIKEI